MWGISPPVVHLKYRKAPVYKLCFACIFIDFPRLNIQMIIISPKSFTYVLFPLRMHSSVPGVPLMVCGGQRPRSYSWLLDNWCYFPNMQLSWHTQSDSLFCTSSWLTFNTVLIVQFHRLLVLQNKHCIKISWAKSSSGNTTVSNVLVFNLVIIYLDINSEMFTCI